MRKFLFFFSFLASLQADILTNQDIVEIYTRFVAVNNTHENRYRYDPLPLERMRSCWTWENKDFPRVIALLEFERIVKEHNLASKKGLAINGLDPEWHYLPRGEVKEVNYTDNPAKYDLHVFDLDEGEFDFVMLNQTLEHVYDPLLCLKNVYRHLSSGAVLYLNVPANNIPHDTPFHYYTGITPVGLGALVQLAGFKILHIGQFGNLEYLNLLFRTHNWPDYRQLKRPGINEFENPAITWIFAIKP